MVNSREKGARLEREAAQALRRELGIVAERAARNGVDGAADLMTNLRDVRFEVKGRRSIGAVRFMDQAWADTPHGSVPVVLMREDGHTDWCLMVPLTHVRQLVERLSQA